MAINYLIIDDEPLAHQLINNFAKQLPYLNKIASCHSVQEATSLLQQPQEQIVDLIFLDVNMPIQTGFDLLKSLERQPKVIIVSAHKDYALESYEYDITDYLLKPFNFERFFKAMQKVTESLKQQATNNNTNEQSIYIKDDKKHHKVKLKDIRYIKANGNYTSVYLNEDSTHSHILSQMKISDFEKLLTNGPSHIGSSSKEPEKQFMRIHRSYLVNCSVITLVKANQVHLGEEIIPVGRVYKENVAALVTD